jgi:hypothetical protein
MRAHYFQHVPFEGLGSMETWLHEAGYEISVTRWYAGERAPDPGKIALLIVMNQLLLHITSCELSNTRTLL